MKVKNVKFEIELEGHGIVNYDSDKQKFVWVKQNVDESAKQRLSVLNLKNTNNKFAKKHYFRNENGDLDYIIKISTDCLRQAIFSGDAIVINPKIAHHKILLNSFIGSPLGLLRGYMFGNDEVIKSNSAITVTAPKQTNNSLSSMELCSRSGEKREKDDSGNGDTTLFNKETIGDITYSARGFFNISALEFKSADTNHGRYSFNPDDYSILKTFLTKNLPNFDTEPAYYQLITASTEAGEYGIKLTSEQIVYLIKEGLKRVYNVNILRSGAYVTLSKMRVQLVGDVLNPQNNKWVDITSISDIDNLDFEVEEYYTKIEESQTLKDREIMEENFKIDVQKRKDKKATKTNKK